MLEELLPWAWRQGQHMLWCLFALSEAIGCCYHHFRASLEPAASGAFMAGRFPGLVVLVQPWGSFVLEFWGLCSYSCI